MTRYLIQFSTASLIAILASLSVASGKQAVTLVAKFVVQHAVDSAIGVAIGMARGQVGTAIGIVLPPSRGDCDQGETCR